MDSAQTTHQTGSQTTSSHHALLWAGAAVSIAEILTGTYLAPLGWERGLLAIVIGHMIGGVLFFFSRLYWGDPTQKCHGNGEG